ncbi:Cys-tRNA(Pro) deacylase [Limisalsivibrio acetivorans]|uniref:Cys-tRNA(Pro) deacylase n=1 Tax=Limisalsivibrio acetivorans TaxID=1304888 RepID=UPI0003B693AA|nr:Cys-tRNA(Pro) deacylase [Limisalsivibrio acetivorans]
MADKFPVTQAVRVFRKEKVDYEPFMYDYEEKGGTAQSAEVLGVDEHNVIKTIIMEDEGGNPAIVLMHGDKEISAKNLARHIGVKKMQPCQPDIANKHTGYIVGGTSPFGTKKKMRVYAEKTIFDRPVIFINGGKRGFLVSMKPSELERVLKPEKVEATAE